MSAYLHTYISTATSSLHVNNYLPSYSSRALSFLLDTHPFLVC